MSIEAKVDFRDLKKQKNSNRKQFKKAIKQKDYDMIQQCLTFVEKYDEMCKDVVGYKPKYQKYFNQLPVDTKEIIKLREQISQLKDIDLTIYEVFEKRISDAIKDHVNKYVEKRLIQMKKSLTTAKKQVSMKAPKRMKAPARQKKLNIT